MGEEELMVVPIANGHPHSAKCGVDAGPKLRRRPWASAWLRRHGGHRHESRVRRRLADASRAANAGDKLRSLRYRVMAASVFW